jgi:glycosyltransferase involved in cell wall biosynthesis
MAHQILISVIMPTLNAEKTIRLALESIRSQNIDAKAVEILVVDGGSSDGTRKIAIEYGCRIIENELVQPECAKHKGILSALGQYAVFLDADEVFNSEDALKKRIQVFRENDDVKLVLTGGYMKPKGWSSVNDYINTFSDPFSFFMYRASSDATDYFENFGRRYSLVRETDECGIFRVGVDKDIPLADLCAGNAIDLRYVEKMHADAVGSVDIIPNMSSLIIRGTQTMAVLKDDYILHHSSDSYRGYLRKIRWRVVSNLHYSGEVGVGYSNREKYQSAWFRLKKYLFFLYVFTFFGMIWDALYYSYKRSNLVHLMHVPLSLYSASIIIYHVALKIIGHKPKLKSYGG